MTYRTIYVRTEEEGRAALESVKAELGALWNDCAVKRATLFDGVVDSYQTEAELNGFRATQGALL